MMTKKPETGHCYNKTKVGVDMLDKMCAVLELLPGHGHLWCFLTYWTWVQSTSVS